MGRPKRELTDVTLETVAGGAAPELFEHKLRDVLENIEDPNTEATDQRKITLEVVFKPEAERDEVSVAVRAKAKLAQHKPAKGRMFVGRQDGELRAVGYDPKQRDLFADPEDDDEAVLPMRGRDETAEGGS